MRVHRRPRRRSKDSGRNSRSHSVDEAYSYTKASTTSPRVRISTSHPGSDISLEDERPSTPFPPPEARLSTSESPGWLPRLGPDQTNVENASKREDDEWLSTENVRPTIRQLSFEGFFFNPGCPHLRSFYLEWLQTNQEDPQPYAIEVLTEPPHRENDPLVPITSAPSDIPCAIRINSKPILDFLASLEGKEQKWIKRRKSMIIGFPFKIMIHHDSAIRNRCNELRQSLDLLKEKLAQCSSQPDQPHASESSTNEVQGTASSEQSSRIMESNATDTESEIILSHHPSFQRRTDDSIREESATQEGPEAGAGTQLHTLPSPLEDKSVQGKIMEGAEANVQHDTDDFFNEISRTSVELEHFQCVVAFMDNSVKPHFEACRNGVPEKVRFLDLWSLFQPGDYILWDEHSRPSQKKPRKPDFHSPHRYSSWGSREKRLELWKVFATSSPSFFQPYDSSYEFNLTAFRIDFDGTSFGPVSFTFSIPSFKGEREVKSFELVPLRCFDDPENLLREHLREGKKFLSCALSSPSFWGYKGYSSKFFHNGDPCPFSMVNEKEIDSRIVVDFKEAFPDGAVLEHSMPELYVSVREKRWFVPRCTRDRFECDDILEDSMIDETISKRFQQTDAFLSRYAKSELYAPDHKDFLGDWELRLLPHRVPAWILSDRKWGLLSVEELRPVERDGELWSELRLRKGQKEAMLSLAQSHFQKTMDIKTSTYTNSECGGVLVLLKGPDGVGKTLAAQSLASVLCKPFYQIMADSLGKDRAEISFNLDRTFSRAEKWDCVLLMEDVEVLMLRLQDIGAVEDMFFALEKFKGFLIFTCYSMNDIELSFFSYIQLELLLSLPAKAQFIDIWESKVDKWNKLYGRNMLMNAEELKKLPHTLWDLKVLEKISGRDIENIFRCAIALAQQEGQTKVQEPLRLGTEHFITIIEAISPRNISGILSQPPTTSSSNNNPSQDRDPGRAAINTTAIILCMDTGLHQLFSKLLSQNVLARGFVSDLGTLFELLERYLISEFSPFEEPGEQNALNEDSQRLACAIGACIANSELPDANAEAGSLVIMQEGSFDALFASDAFALFKEDLAEVVRLKTKNPRWEAQNPEFLLRGITMEESLAVNHHSRSILGIFQEPLRSLGLLERPVATGKRRIRWQCAMQNLLLHTRRMTSRDPDSNSYHERGFFGRLLPGLLSYLGFRGSPRADATLPFTSDPRVADRSQLGELEGEEGQVHLLICMDDGKYSSGLFQEAIHDVNCDRELFQRVNDAYKKRRRQKRSFLSLRAVESIEFATVSTNHAKFVLSSNHSNVCGQWLNSADGEQFHLIFGNIADVRRHERHCNEQRCHCLPPADKVWPRPAAEYRYEPVPADKSPPIGSNTLMHFLQSPECVAEKQKWILKQFPKKIRGKLSAQLDGPVQGWGIHLKEGRNKGKILLFISLNLIMLLIFGLVWSEVKKDVQGGFGVAACWIAVIGVALTYMDMSSV